MSLLILLCVCSHPDAAPSSALQLLWKHQFVHRDCSTGNVLWDPETKTGRLSDLEFVKEVTNDDISGRELRTVRYALLLFFLT